MCTLLLPQGVNSVAVIKVYHIKCAKCGFVQRPVITARNLRLVHQPTMRATCPTELIPIDLVTLVLLCSIY